MEMFNSLYEMMILFIKKENHTQKRRIAFYISKFKSGDREMAIFWKDGTICCIDVQLSNTKEECVNFKIKLMKRKAKSN